MKSNLRSKPNFTVLTIIPFGCTTTGGLNTFFIFFGIWFLWKESKESQRHGFLKGKEWVGVKIKTAFDYGNIFLYSFCKKRQWNLILAFFYLYHQGYSLVIIFWHDFRGGSSNLSETRTKPRAYKKYFFYKLFLLKSIIN